MAGAGSGPVPAWTGKVVRGCAVDVRGTVAAGCLSALFALMPGPAGAGDGDCPSRRCSNAEPVLIHGAIAYSPSTRAHGWAFDYESRKEAEEVALERCGHHAGDCVVTVRFKGGCGALAVGADGYGSGWGASRKLAERFAIKSCSRYSGACEVIRWVCTSKSSRGEMVTGEW
jgi:serine/threonine-protein kinase